MRLLPYKIARWSNYFSASEYNTLPVCTLNTIHKCLNSFLLSVLVVQCSICYRSPQTVLIFSCTVDYSRLAFLTFILFLFKKVCRKLKRRMEISVISFCENMLLCDFQTRLSISFCLCALPPSLHLSRSSLQTRFSSTTSSPSACRRRTTATTPPSTLWPHPRRYVADGERPAVTAAAWLLLR